MVLKRPFTNYNDCSFSTLLFDFWMCITKTVLIAIGIKTHIDKLHNIHEDMVFSWTWCIERCFSFFFLIISCVCANTTWSIFQKKWQIKHSLHFQQGNAFHNCYSYYIFDMCYMCHLMNVFSVYFLYKLLT